MDDKNKYKELEKPYISVIVPIYNVEKYLPECIESIINQTYKKLEIILVDDGSSDSSGDIVDNYKKIDSRIKVVHKSNGGIISARKVGVDIATGEYITFVDGDDWIEPVMYQEMIELSSAYMPDIITSGVKRDYGNHTVDEFDQCEEGYYSRNDLEDKIYPIAIYTGVFFESGINIHVYNKLYKSKLIIEKYQQIDERINVGEDAAIIYPCIYSANSLFIIQKAYYHYRIREGSCLDNDENGEEERINILKKCLYSAICNNSLVEKNTVKKEIDAIILFAKLLQVPDRVIQEDKYGYLYPFGKLKRNCRIVLYGAGRFGKRVKSILESKYDISVVAWIDKNSNGQESEKTQPIEAIKFIDGYDYLVIAVLKGNIIYKIIEELNRFGIEKEKIAYIEDGDIYRIN